MIVKITMLTIRTCNLRTKTLRIFTSASSTHSSDETNIEKKLVLPILSQKCIEGSDIKRSRFYAFILFVLVLFSSSLLGPKEG